MVTFSSFCANDWLPRGTAAKTKIAAPITEEDGTTIVDMRFYNNEIVDLFMILFYEIGNIPINTNYYEVLLSVREKIKKSKMSEE